MNPVTLGVVTSNGAWHGGLAAAVEQHPGVAVRRVAPADQPVDGIDGLVIDVPPPDRQAVALQLARRWRVPVLLEAPAALTAGGVDELAKVLAGASVFSENRLDHHLPTRRLREQVTAAADPVEQIFAAWRFRRGQFDRGTLVQLVDYLERLVRSRVERSTTMRRSRPDAFLISFRYENGVVASLEIGAHLPEGLPQTSELLIECFCRDTVYHCDPGHQAITVDGRAGAAVDWSESALEHIVSTFVGALAAGRAPERSLDRDRGALAIAGTILDG